MPKLKDLTFLKELVEAGKVTPAIDRTYPLGDAADAFGYLGHGHAGEGRHHHLRRTFVE